MHAGLAKIAARQLGLVTTRKLRLLDLAAAKTRSLVVHGTLIPIRTNVYRLAGVPTSWEQAVLAAAFSAGPEAVVSHATAAAVWNLRHSDRFGAGLHLTNERRVRIEGVTGHVARLTSEERTVRRLIPITTPERTIIDLADTLTVTQLGQCIDDAIRRHLVALERLRKLVGEAAARGGRRRLTPLRRVLADRIPGFRPDDSDFETRMNRMWDAVGLPPAKRQYRVSIDGHSYRLDRAIVECKIGTEWDSYRYHSAPSDRDYDNIRRARLTGDGWLIIPVTANVEPELVASAVMRAYRDRMGTGGPGE